MITTSIIMEITILMLVLCGRRRSPPSQDDDHDDDERYDHSDHGHNDDHDMAFHSSCLRVEPGSADSVPGSERSRGWVNELRQLSISADCKTQKQVTKTGCKTQKDGLPGFTPGGRSWLCSLPGFTPGGRSWLFSYLPPLCLLKEQSQSS